MLEELASCTYIDISVDARESDGEIAKDGVDRTVARPPQDSHLCREYLGCEIKRKKTSATSGERINGD